jgi:hypothetical protein
MQNHMPSRKKAAESGLPRYFTGVPCKNGHVAERFTSSGNCIACNNEARKSYVTRTKQAANVRKQGLFFHQLDAEDFAAARAYCQALNMARGRIPWSPDESAPVVVPINIDAERRRILGAAADMASDTFADPAGQIPWNRK